MFKTAIFVQTILAACRAESFSEQIFTKQDNLTDYIPTSGYLLETYTPRSLSDCGATCLMTSNCTTFFYDRSYRRCQLHTSLPEDTLSMASAPNATCYSSQVAQSSLVCPNGTSSYNGGERCYYVLTSVAMDFNASKVACLQSGGMIVKIDSAQQNDFIKNILEKAPAGNYYIGLNDEMVPNTFEWSDPASSPISYNDWGPGNPAMNDENCVVMYSPDMWRWHTTNCPNVNYVVCQK